MDIGTSALPDRIIYLYHITHIDNLDGIFKHGLMGHSKNVSYRKKLISKEEVNARRSEIEPIYGLPIKHYSLLYFNAANAMLYSIYEDYKEKYKKKGLEKYKEKALEEYKKNIIIICYSKSIIKREYSLYTNGCAARTPLQDFTQVKDNATLFRNNKNNGGVFISKYIKDLSNPKFIDWQKVFCRVEYKGQAMAEVLIPGKVKNDKIEAIYILDCALAHTINDKTEGIFKEFEKETEHPTYKPFPYAGELVFYKMEVQK